MCVYDRACLCARVCTCVSAFVHSYVRDVCVKVHGYLKSYPCQQNDRTFLLQQLLRQQTSVPSHELVLNMKYTLRLATVKVDGYKAPVPNSSSCQHQLPCTHGVSVKTDI